MSEILSKHKNQTVKDMFALLQKELQPLDELQDKVKKASPPPVAQLDKELAESEDPTDVEFREAIQRAEDAVRIAREDAHKHMLRKYKTLNPDELEKLKNAYGQQATRAKKAWGMLNDFAEMMPNTDGVKEALAEIRIPNLKTLGNTTGRTNVGDGGPRPRITSVTIVRKDGAAKTDTKISPLMIWAKLKSTDVYRAWYEAAGVDQWQDITETHTFTVEECEITIEPVVHTEDDE